MMPAAFDYMAPESLDDALAALNTRPEDAKILAGGQSLLALMKLRLANPKLVIDLRKIPALAEIREEGQQLIIGALTTHFQIESSPLVQKKCPLLRETARMIGDVQVRNRGTLGGSLTHADPAADWPAAILALAGELKLAHPQGDRWIGAGEFFLGPMTTAIAPTEILTAVRVPVAAGRSGVAYQKMAQQASGFAIVGVAVVVKLDQDTRCEEIGIGVTGLSEKPFRASAVEERLRGEKLTVKIIEAASAHTPDGIEPLEDLHASADYRAHLARIHTRRAIQEAAKKAARPQR
jgi:aerobic carbon-monoxide dehydrogenase medium subunit